MSDLQYDIVWFSDANRQRALELLRPLTLEERVARRLSYGIRSWVGVPIPDETGSITQERGGCICRNFLGSSALCAGAHYPETRKLKMSPFIMVKRLEDGLTVANIQEDAYDNEFFRPSLETEKRNEAHRLAREREEQATLTEEETAERSKALRRYFIAVANLLGVKNPNRIPVPELQDLYIMAVLNSHELPPLAKWMSTVCPDAGVDEQEFEPQDPSGFWEFDTMLRASTCSSVEKTKGA